MINMMLIVLRIIIRLLESLLIQLNQSKRGDPSIMKKNFVASIVFFLFLTGCSSEKKQDMVINNPYEVLVKGKILSYYDTGSQINTNEFEISRNWSDASNNTTDNIIVTDEDNKIRCISINDSKVITYGQIAVGDSIKKVINTFDNEYKMSDNSYCVLFNGNQEEDPTNTQKENSWIWINYLVDDGNIVRILIYDVEFGINSR